MMAGSASFIMTPHLYHSLQLTSSMDNFPSLDNLAAASFQSTGNNHQNQQFYQQQQQQVPHHPLQPDHLDLVSDKQSAPGLIPELMFDISSLNHVSSDGTTPAHSSSLSVAPIGTNPNSKSQPLSLDPINFQSSAVYGGNSIDNGDQMTTSAIDDGTALTMTNIDTKLPFSSQLPMQTLASTGSNSNQNGFISSSLPAPLSAMPNTTMQPQHTNLMHPNMPLGPSGRPYNMMFGVPGMADAPVVYDDRMSMPPMPHGSWLRIRQPIDYVAPLKKPMNSFLLYSAERRVQLRQTHPDLNTTQQSTILAREWANLPEEEKEKYRAEAKQLRDDYNARRAELSLKLQQQLNQQHLGLNLGHPPPSHPPHATIHLPSQDLLGQPMPADNHSNSVNPFGLSQSYSGMQLGSTQFHPLTPAGTQNPPAQQDDSYVQAQSAGSSVAGQSLQFGNPFSTLDSANGVSQTQAGQSTPQPLDITAGGFLANIYDRHDSKWQELVSGSELQDNTGISQPQSGFRPASRMSQHSEYSRQKTPLHSSICVSGALNPSMLSSANMFETPFVFQSGSLHNNMGGFSESEKFATQHNTSCISLSDIRNNHMGGRGSFDNNVFFGGSRTESADPDTLPELHVQDRRTFHDDSSKTSSVAASSSKLRGRVSSPAKRTRKKSKKDPDAPKHPMSAFLYYLTSERPRLADQLGDMSIGQQTKIIAKRWKTLNENDRAPWEKLAKHDKDRYARERREYHGETRQTENIT
ncbi:High mobility group [Coemansia sp. RSA 1821]|nr:High mobility group [Coemansia sp. RSA 1821]